MKIVSRLDPGFFAGLTGLITVLQEQSVDSLEIKLNKHSIWDSPPSTVYTLQFYSKEKCIGVYKVSRVGKTIIHYLNDKEIMSQQIQR